jgi:hypothetical protein
MRREAASQRRHSHRALHLVDIAGAATDHYPPDLIDNLKQALE